MRIAIKFIAAVCLCFQTLLAVAEDAGEQSVRSPADMTVEERTQMMKTASKYNNCVYSQAIAKIGDVADIRHAADFAMGQCQDKIDDLEAGIKTMGFGQNFATGFSKRVRNRAVRKILPELAIRKSGG